jgi:cell division ATPase FtsA
MSTASPFIGIDFGTSKSAMAWFNPQGTGQAEHIYSDGREETPSIVYIGAKKGGRSDIRVGQAAAELLESQARMSRPGVNGSDLRRFVISIKRNLANEPDLLLDGTRYTPEFVVSQILGKLKNDAERFHFRPMVGFQHPLSRVVITVPAKFGETERGKIREAARQAGFITVEFLAEPAAAALAFARSSLRIGQYVLVYDYGAGTFDVAVLGHNPSVAFQPVVPPDGTDNCGGDSIDRILYDYFDAQAQRSLGLSFNQDGNINPLILRLCRLYKENLSRFTDPEPFSAYIQSNGNPVNFRGSIDRDKFEELIRPKIQETVDMAKRVRENAGKEGYTVDTVLLVGGSSRLPLVEHLLGEAFAKEEIQVWDRQHIAVALGAAYYAEERWGAAFAEYRQAVSNAWEPTKRLTSAQAQKLESLTKSKQLDSHEAANIEQVVMGCTKEEVLTRQYREACAKYREALQKVAPGEFFRREQLAALTNLASELGIHKADAEAIERAELNQATKEEVRAYWHQYALKLYRSAVAEIKQDKFPSLEQIKALESKAKELDLLENEVAAIEREELLDSKENYYTKKHQEALSRYQALVANVWQDKWLTGEQVKMLADAVTEFHLSKEEAATHERIVMGHRKETILKHQEYQIAVKNFWEPAEQLTPPQVDNLANKVKELGIRPEAAIAIEQRIMGYSKEVILKRQDYRAAVQLTWRNRPVSQLQFDALVARRNELGISDNDAEAIERSEMEQETALEHYQHQHEKALEMYRTSVQKVKELADPLASQASQSGLSQEEVEAIHRELMPALLPPTPIRADRYAPLLFLVICAALAGGFFGDSLPTVIGNSQTTATVLAIIATVAAVLSFVWLIHKSRPKRANPGNVTAQSFAAEDSIPKQTQG